MDLNEVTLNYYLVTYRGETQKYLECTVYGLKEGTHYPVIRPETVEKERSVDVYKRQASLFHYKELEIRDLKKYLWERGIAVRM